MCPGAGPEIPEIFRGGLMGKFKGGFGTFFIKTLADWKNSQKEGDPQIPLRIRPCLGMCMGKGYHIAIF